MGRLFGPCDRASRSTNGRRPSAPSRGPDGVVSRITSRPPGSFTLRRIARGILVWATALGAFGVLPARGADEPRPAAAKDDAPIFILLEGGGATDLDALRRRLGHPDFVILNGARYEAMKVRGQGPVLPTGPIRGVVESVTVGGEVLDDL